MRKKFRLSPSHFSKLPVVNWDQPEDRRLEKQREAVRIARTNLAIAHDEFERESRIYDDYDRSFSPHEFRKPPATDATLAYIPLKCAICHKERGDRRHGSVAPHAFATCGRSWRRPLTIGSIGRCFECGLPANDEAHDMTKKTEKPTLPRAPLPRQRGGAHGVATKRLPRKAKHKKREVEE